MAGAEYDVGDLIRITGTWTDADGNVTDPNVIKGNTENPSGTTAQLTISTGITKSSTGVYYFDMDLNEEGRWKYRLYGIATGDSSSQGAGSSWLIAKDWQ